jgi:hypothetical protein
MTRNATSYSPVASTSLFSTLHIAMIMKLEANKLFHLWTNYAEAQTVDSDKIELYVVLLVHLKPVISHKTPGIMMH